jgi:hypothetical protein
MTSMTVLKLDPGETLTIPLAAEPESVILWCSQDDIVWTMEYLLGMGDFLDEATASWAAGNLTITTTGTLWIMYVAAFDRPLTVQEFDGIHDAMVDGIPFVFDSLLPYASDEEFGGYVFRRLNVNTGVEEVRAVLPSRDETRYIDREAGSGYTYRYSVTYLHLVEGIEWVESARREDDETLFLANLVLSNMEIEGDSVPVRWWESRRATRHMSTEVVPTLGRKPIAFHGIMSYDQIDISFYTVDDPYGTFNSREHMEALLEIIQPATGENDQPIPKDLCLRDPSGRVLYGSVVTPFVIEDDHGQNQRKGSFTFVENATYVRNV